MKMPVKMKEILTIYKVNRADYKACVNVILKNKCKIHVILGINNLLYKNSSLDIYGYNIPAFWHL